MLSIFRRRGSPTASSTPAAPSGYLTPERPAALLNTPRRRKLLENIWQRTSLSRKQFASLYTEPLERYAALVQQLPASENHHHAYAGGMLDHGLEIVAYALKIRQTYLLPIGAPPESQAAQAEAWSAAAAYGALLHDLGKIAVDVQIEGLDGKPWHPWHGPLSQPYRFRYVKDRDYRLHSAAAALLAPHVLTRPVLDWLSGFPELWSQLLFSLAGQYEHAGILGEIVTQADQASVAQELGGNPARALAAPKQSLQRQLADGLRVLIADKFKLNQPDGPSDGWLTQDALWLMSKSATDHLRAHLLSQGIEGIPSSNAPMFNLLQDQAIIQTNAQDKAIWKIQVNNGRGWVNEFTVLKIAPALIWKDASERPEPYGGTVTVLGSEEATPKTEVPTPNIAAPLPSPSAGPEAPQPTAPGIATTATTAVTTVPAAPSTTPASPPTEDDGIDELLGLLNDAVSPSGTVSPICHKDTAVPMMSDIATAPSETPLAAQSPAETTTSTPLPSSDPASLGQHFLDWVRTGIQTRKLVINDAKARVHTVAGTVLLVSPEIFKRYALEHPELQPEAKGRNLESWQLVQRAFEKLKCHRKTGNLNIWTCEVVGPRKSRPLKGYLLEEPSRVLTQTAYDNPSLRLLEGDALANGQ